MILADTSVWIDHLRSPLSQLAEFANAGQILMHSIIVGELACGNLSDRRQRLRDWQRLPMIPQFCRPLNRANSWDRESASWMPICSVRC